MRLQYLKKYQTFENIKAMDDMVQEHVSLHYDELTSSYREVLYCLASHSLAFVGASHLKTETIAKELGCSVKTVYRATKKLEELGIISKYKTTKSTGQGASIYTIAPNLKCQNVCHSMSDSCPSLETTVSLTLPKDEGAFFEPEAKNLSTSSFNPYVINNANTYYAGNSLSLSKDLKANLRDSYSQDSSFSEDSFNEMSKIGFGRIKQFMASHGLPFTQMESIVLTCMNDLIIKKGVNNKFAMYSKMIERKVLQLFEAPVEAPKRIQQKSKELIPEWFNTRHNVQETADNGIEIDFEAERLKILKEMGLEV